MKLLLFACLAVAILPLLATAKNVVCYFASWTVYRAAPGNFDVENIDPSLCTHMLFAFIGINQEGTIRIIDPWYSNDHYRGFEKFVALRENNPNLKVLVSMGGWNEDSKNFSIVAANPHLRRQLAEEILEFIQQWKFDGFDIDWEYPGLRNTTHPIEDKDDFINFLLELKTLLYPRGYLLSAAVAGAVEKIDVAYDVKKVSRILDMLNVMVYDFHGHFEPYVGHVAPLYKSDLDNTGTNATLNVAAGIDYWIKKGADPSKLNLGIVTYGRCFTLTDPSNTQLYAPATAGLKGPYTNQSGFLGYNEICSLHSDWKYVWDDQQRVPHRVGGENQWVGYDDPDSIKLKVEFAKSRKLGGLMVWALDTDDFAGWCGERYPLLKAINKNLDN